MNKQSIEFAVKKTDNIVSRIGKSYITHPEICFTGGSTKWYQDRLKKQYENKNG